MKTPRLLLGFLLAAAMRSPTWAAEETLSVANKAAPLTLQGGTARAMSMGSAFVAVAEGSESLMWNPAGLAYLCGKEVGLNHTSGIGNSTRELGIFGTSAGSLGGVAASLEGVSNGSFEGRDEFGNQTGNYHAGDAGARVGWGKTIISRLAIGAALRTNYQTLAGTTYSAYAADLGVLWNPFSSFKLGATFANLNIANTYGAYALNSAWHLGVSYRPLQPLLVAIAGELQPGGVQHMQLGGEYILSPLLSFRGGYQLDYPNNDLSGATGFTLGVGLQLGPHIAFDYAFVPQGDLGASHRVGLTYKFGCDKECRIIAPVEVKIIPPAPITPAAAEAPPKVIAFADTHFDFDQSSLTIETKRMLNAYIQILKDNPEATVRIVGFTSAQGTAAYNQKLSERRADAVKAYFMGGGISAERLSVVGEGVSVPAMNETNPQDINSSAARTNMRTLFEIVVKQ